MIGIFFLWSKCNNPGQKPVSVTTNRSGCNLFTASKLKGQQSKGWNIIWSAKDKYSFAPWKPESVVTETIIVISGHSLWILERIGAAAFTSPRESACSHSTFSSFLLKESRSGTKPKWWVSPDLFFPVIIEYKVKRGIIIRAVSVEKKLYKIIIMN